MRGLCSAPGTDDSDLLELLAMKWLLDLVDIVEARCELHDVEGEVGAVDPQGICRRLGLRLVDPLLAWRMGRAGWDEVVDAFSEDSPFRFVSGLPSTAPGEERRLLEDRLATCLLRGDTLLDSEVPLVLVRRLLALEVENRDSAANPDPSDPCSWVVEPVLEVVRARCEVRLAGSGMPDAPESRTPQQEVDRQRKHLKQLFALAWFGAPERLGPKLAGEIGKCALDRAMRLSDPAAMTKRIREARTRGEDDTAIRAILNGVEPERGVEENENGEREVGRDGALVSVELVVPILEQMGLTADKCPQRHSSFETTACTHCLLGKRCPSRARSIVTREVGDWLAGFAEGARDIARHHQAAKRFRIWLEPVGPNSAEAGLKRTFAPGDRGRDPPRKT